MRHLPWKSVVFTALDLETTAFNLPRLRICELAAVPIHGGVVEMTNAFVKRVNPQTPFMEKRATRLHGLRIADVCNQPTLSQHWPELEPHLRNVLIAHGASSDIRWLMRARPSFQPPIVLDTCKWARKLHPHGYGLDDLVEWYDLHSRIAWHPEGRDHRRHRAYYDAAACGLLFVELARRHLKPNATLGDIAAICEYKLD